MCISRKASRSCRREMGRLSGEFGFGMRERPHCLAPRGMRRVARMMGMRRWSDSYQIRGSRARMLRV